MCGLLFVDVKIFCIGFVCFVIKIEHMILHVTDRQALSYALSPTDSCYFEIESQLSGCPASDREELGLQQVPPHLTV